MIDRNHQLPVAKQCRVLKLSRSSTYYQPRATRPTDLELMHRIDKIHLEYPFAGSRMIRDMLKREGHMIGRRHTRTLMRKMDIHALYRKPHTSMSHPAHPVYPYLLRGLKIERANHVWAGDITYIPMRRVFVYLVVVMDWATRRVLSWLLSNSLSTDFCIEAAQEALGLFGKPETFNTDQGSQFTSVEFTELLKEKGIAISMDGRGCWRDNVFVERLWRSITYEEIYLLAYDSVSETKKGLERYLTFYNHFRPHSMLDGLTPNEAYQKGLDHAA